VCNWLAEGHRRSVRREVDRLAARQVSINAVLNTAGLAIIAYGVLRGVL
jgi:hypothetical protein